MTFEKTDEKSETKSEDADAAQVCCRQIFPETEEHFLDRFTILFSDRNEIRVRPKETYVQMHSGTASKHHERDSSNFIGDPVRVRVLFKKTAVPFLDGIADVQAKEH